MKRAYKIIRGKGGRAIDVLPIKKKVGKKNTSRKTIRNRLDKEVSAEVRARGACERCGWTINLQCCHIFSRRYSKLRHNKLNLLCLCSGCHFWAHSNPVLFTLFVQKHLGARRFRKLIALKNELVK